jgi:hypothetical protein
LAEPWVVQKVEMTALPMAVHLARWWAAKMVGWLVRKMAETTAWRACWWEESWAERRDNQLAALWALKADL